MIVRFLASLVSAGVVAGCAALIGSEIIGIDNVKAWVDALSAPKQQAALPQALIGVKNLTFFAEVPAEAGAFNVMTGVKYAEADDLLTENEDSRWCYVMIEGSPIDRRLDLGGSEKGGDPTYTDLSSVSERDLDDLGVTRVELAAIARSGCRFTGRLS